MYQISNEDALFPFSLGTKSINQDDILFEADSDSLFEMY